MMLTILFSILRRVWWLIPIAAALAFGAWERHEATSAKAHAAQLEQQVGAAQASIGQLRAGITAQNAGVERILQQQVAAEKSAQQQVQQREQTAEKVRVVYQTRVERIEAAPVPATCASAAAWAAGQAQGLAAGWSK